MKTISMTPKKPSRERIIRAIASSTAIETGRSVKSIEASLNAKKSKFQHLTLGS